MTDYDKKMFSRKGYECKDLLQGRGRIACGVVSSKQDKNFPIWKVQYGFFVSGVPLLMKMQWISAETDLQD